VGQAHRLVLFDLDGTLVDTAADLAAAANQCRADRGLEALPLDALRPYASHGARGMLGKALNLRPDAADYERVRMSFLSHYEQAICVHSRLFTPLDSLLDELSAARILWGIVTNKAARYTNVLVRSLGLHDRAACVVSGDTTAHAKPHPGPVLHALETTGFVAGATVFIGDDRRDITAGRAAGTLTAAAAYGYLADDDDTSTWGADHVFASPAALRDWVKRWAPC
jgi:2-phosphoglycolate phosphatase